MTSRRECFKGIIFDMDGVLVDSEPHHYDAEDIIFDTMGIHVSKKMRDSFTGISNDIMWQTIKDHLSLETHVNDLKTEAEKIRLKYFKNIKDLQAIEGAKELLKKLRISGTAAALASSSTLDLIELMLDRIGLTRYFPHRVSGEEVQCGKPAPDIFLEAAHRLGLEPSSCCVIEDSYNGVKAAKDAGMTVYAFRGGNDNTQDLSGADKTFTSFKDISLFLF